MAGVFTSILRFRWPPPWSSPPQSTILKSTRKYNRSLPLLLNGNIDCSSSWVRWWMGWSIWCLLALHSSSTFLLTGSLDSPNNRLQAPPHHRYAFICWCCHHSLVLTMPLVDLIPTSSRYFDDFSADIKEADKDTFFSGRKADDWGSSPSFTAN